MPSTPLPDDVVMLLRRGARLQATGFPGPAYNAYAQALALTPTHAKVRAHVGDFLLLRGELDEAHQLFALAADAGEIGGFCGLVEVRERRGQLAEAWGLLEQVPGAIEQSLAVRMVATRVLDRSGHTAQALALLTEVDTSPLSVGDAAGVQYQIGDLHDRLVQPRDAFAAWTRANRLRRLTFDAGQHAREVSRALGTYHRAALSSLPKGDPSDRPVFIVGVPRSGTSLVEQILAAHPNVHGAGELSDIAALMVATDATDATAIAHASRKHLERLATLNRDALRVTDKMPFNAMYLGFITQLFPNATIIHCVRDAADTALSIYGRNFSDWHRYAASLTDIAEYTAQHERLMAHWHSVLSRPMLEVRYEELVANSEAVIRGLVEHVRLPWDPAVLEFHRSGRTTTTASYAQVSEPLYTSSVGRARAYEPELAEFREALARAREDAMPSGRAQRARSVG